MRLSKILRLQSIMNRPKHPFHLVEFSPWPILISFALMSFALGLVRYLTLSETNILPQLLLIILITSLWFRDIMREAFGGYHTKRVQKTLMLGFLVFLSTEFMLFFSLFWAFFHSSLSPSIELGFTWPPIGINFIDPLSIPLLGSVILLSSGFVLTLSHHLFLKGNKYLSLLTMLITVILGFLFVFIQYNEYTYSEFTISDSVLGSVFYLTTGLHAIHVIAGATFLAICGIRIYLDQFTLEHNLGLTFAIYYFHFVDVIWLAVFFLYYYWGA